MILDKLFELMAEKQASDMFVTVGSPIQVKLQGVVVPVNQQIITPDMANKIAYDLMSPQQQTEFEEKHELNISKGVAGLGNFRVNFFMQRSSVSLVIRYVLGNIPNLDTLGLPDKLAELILEKRGLILLVGSTGSGKSTTIAAMLDYRNEHESGHILTVEDPIEFLFKHKKSMVNQREIGVDTDNWHTALRSAMRQAPDCIMIGEIRDPETMAAAVSYAQTGHMCISTLHANNAYYALNRIVSFFPQDARAGMLLDLSSSLRAIISQRLVRKADGSQVAACEILLNNLHVSELIQKGDFEHIKESMEKMQATGSQTFEQDLMRLYTEEHISIDEALSNADSPSNLSWLINNTDHKNSASTGIGNLSQGDEENASFQEFSIELSEGNNSDQK